MKKLIWINDIGTDKLTVGAFAKSEDDCEKIVTGFLALLNKSEQTAKLFTIAILNGINASESDIAELKRIFDGHIETIKNNGNGVESTDNPAGNPGL